MAGTRSAAGPPAGGADVTRLRVAVEAGGDGAAVTAPAAPAAAPVELDERKRRVLRTVVTEFVATGQPVGSAHVVAVAGLDVSTATVRNDLAALEELGLVSQPHASAGRVPTDRGYRWFVDDLLDPRRRAAIEELLGSARDVEELLSRTATVLTQLTRLVALVISPALETSRLRLVELVTLTPATALLLLVSDTGRVEKHAVELPAGTDERDLDRVRAMLADRLVGRRFAEVGTVLRALCDEARAARRAGGRAGAAAAGAPVREERVHEVYVGGQAALAGDASLDRGDLSRLLELLEERETLARLLEDAAEGDGPRVRIGEEHAQEDLRATSLVAQRYRLVADGSLGVLGPTRMDYGGALATVRAVSDQLQRTLRDLTADG